MFKKYENYFKSPNVNIKIFYNKDLFGGIVLGHDEEIRYGIVTH